MGRASFALVALLLLAPPRSVEERLTELEWQVAQLFVDEPPEWRPKPLPKAAAITAGPLDDALNPWPSTEDHARLRASWAINDKRKALGLGALALDPGLNRAASQGARAIAAGGQPHAGFPDRCRAQGWSYANCNVRSGAGNLAEGISWGGLTPEAAVLTLDLDIYPEHQKDFRDPAFTHCGIGFARATAGAYAGRMVCTVDYGARCQ